MLSLPLRWFCTAAAILLVAGSEQRAGAQTIAKQLEPYRKAAPEPGDARSRIVELREATVRLAPADTPVFTAMGLYLVNRVTYAEYYVTTPEPSDLKPRPADKTVTELLNEIHKYMLVPGPDGKLTFPQEDYIRELGVALDKPLAAILLPEKGKQPPAILRVNAGRMLATACESGAPAHWPTVIALLKNPETPPEVLYWTLKAAEGLLGGFDVSRLSRLAPTPEAADGVLYDLVHTLETMVVKGPPILDKLHVDSTAPTLSTDPKVRPGAGLVPEQVLALQMYRLQAVRALARLRTDTLGGKTKPALEVRPVFTLARVAIGDPAISPVFSKREIAEAVIGMARINPGANLNMDELTYAMSYGLRTVFSAKATEPDDNSIPWKGYAGRLNTALQDWQAACAKNARVSAKQRDSIGSLVKKASDGLFAPILTPTGGAGGNSVNLEPIDGWQRDNRPGSDRQLFSDVKTFKLTYAANQ